MKNPTMQQFRAFVIQNKAAVATLEQLRADAVEAQQFVERITAPIFSRYHFVGRDGMPITRPEDIYLSPDEVMCAAYFEEVAAANVAAGWKGERNICPHLAAQSAVLRAENEIIKAGCKLFDSNIFMNAYGERRKEVLTLLCSPCL